MNMMFKLYSNGLSRIMSICVNYTHVRYIRYVVRNERNLYILSCQADTDSQQKRYRQSKMKSFLLNFLFVDGFRFKKKHFVGRCDLQYKVYIENMFINENNCISSTSFCPPRPLLPSLPKAQQISNELAGLHALRCWPVGRPWSSWNNIIHEPSWYTTWHVMKSCCMTAM